MGGLYVGLTLMLTFNMVVGTGRFEVSILAFFNESGRMAGESCCSGSRDNDTCISLCPTFISVCLQHHSVLIPEFPACTYGHAVTPVFNRSLTDDAKPTKNMYSIKIPFQFSWPESFSLVIDAWQGLQLNHATKDLSNRILRDVVLDKLSPPSLWVKRRTKTAQLELIYEYRVVCDEFYYSDTCEQICRHRNDNFGHYVCDETGSKVCLPGWQGEFCQEAVCTERCNSSRGYCDKPFECRCLLGWTGESCDVCIPSPGCVHGFCYEPWQCICQNGWSGRYCNIDQNYCANHQPCRNGGTCINDANKNFTCACSIGYTGQRCENVVCFNSICQNGGKCQKTSENNATCVCPDGFYGQHCEYKKHYCKDINCANAGTCVEDANGARCLCVEGFDGKNCQSEIDECRSNPCKNGGTCLDGFNDFICRCRENYIGKTCGIIMDPCHGITCLNGGRCDITVSFRGECACPSGFTGKRCESSVKVCESMPCGNGGSCLVNENKYSCVCLKGYYGDHCEYSSFICSPNSCQNGGICKQHSNLTSCICPSEFVGDRCESSVIELEEDFSGAFSPNSCASFHPSSLLTLFLFLNLLIPT